MNKMMLVGGLALAGSVAAVLLKHRASSGYEHDAIDTAMATGPFGERGAPAPEQRMAEAETRTDISPERLSMAARLSASAGAIRRAFPSVADADIAAADGDLDRLAERIAAAHDGERGAIRRELSDILARETPRPSYPAH